MKDHPEGKIIVISGEKGAIWSIPVGD